MPLKELAYKSPLLPDEDEKLRVLAIMMKNKEKNFIKRALYPDESPRYDFGGGSHGSHYMGWTTLDNGKHIVYPSLVQKPGARKLQLLEGGDEVDYALKSGEYVSFDDPKEADWFSQRYKTIWGKTR
jgi:hypothetical protein